MTETGEFDRLEVFPKEIVFSKPGDVVQVRERSRNMALVIEAMSSGEREVPEYVEVDQKAGTAKFVRMPALSDIPYAARMEPNLVVEFYSS